jgi:hypothetical protein
MDDKIIDTSSNMGMSRSLRIFCNDNQNIEGMIAYALYKFDQTNWAARKERSPEELNNYIDSLEENKGKFDREAQRLLEKYIFEVHEEWYQSSYAEIENSVYGDIIEKVKEQLKENELNYISEIRLLNDQIVNLKN